MSDTATCSEPELLREAATALDVLDAFANAVVWDGAVTWHDKELEDIARQIAGKAGSAMQSRMRELAARMEAQEGDHA